MPPLNSSVFKTHDFTHNQVSYVVSAYTEPANPGRVSVDVTANGKPVVITYPDGINAVRGYYVDLETRLDVQRTMGISAVDELMKIAEGDIRQQPLVRNNSDPSAV